MRDAALLVVLLGVAPATPALAQDATAGKSLYKTYCQVCHTVDPSTSVEPFNGIMEAADNPAAIAAAAQADPSQMGWITTVLDGVDLADVAAYLGTLKSSSATVAVVEFYNVARDHYFMSAAPAEIADLDAGIHAGWVRTGLSFEAFAVATVDTSPVCRFYLPPAYGDSHFYSASPIECAQTAAQYPGFAHETAAAFHVGLPDPLSGACAAGWSPVYRVWDNRSDTNHRYTTSPAVRQQMLGQGWVGEGYGPMQVIMCAPP
jgi:cytochrome c553